MYKSVVPRQKLAHPAFVARQPCHQRRPCPALFATLRSAASTLKSHLIVSEGTLVLAICWVATDVSWKVIINLSSICSQSPLQVSMSQAWGPEERLLLKCFCHDIVHLLSKSCYDVLQIASSVPRFQEETGCSACLPSRCRCLV